MKHCLIYLILLVSCNTLPNPDDHYSKFENYVKQVPKIQLPFIYSTNSGIITAIPNVNVKELSKFSKFWNDKTIGKIFESDEYSILVYREIGDYGPVPIFVTYNQNGKKIISFNAYKTSGDEMGYKSSEYITVDKDLNIAVIDSTITWKINADGTNIIEGTDSISTGKTIYRLDNKGTFVKQ